MKLSAKWLISCSTKDNFQRFRLKTTQNVKQVIHVFVFWIAHSVFCIACSVLKLLIFGWLIVSQILVRAKDISPTSLSHLLPPSSTDSLGSDFAHHFHHDVHAVVACICYVGFCICIAFTSCIQVPWFCIMYLPCVLSKKIVQSMWHSCCACLKAKTNFVCCMLRFTQFCHTINFATVGLHLNKCKHITVL